MITEEQARTLFQADPAATLDARAVLAAGRRARRRRTVAAAALAGASAVAVAAVAVGAGSAGDPPAVVRLADPPLTASPAAPRFEAGQIGNAIVIGSYVQAGSRHDVYAYFTTKSVPSSQTPSAGVTMVCTLAVGPGGGRTNFGCHGPAIDPGQDIGSAGGSPGSTENGAASTFGPLGRGYSFTVVSTRVVSGGVYDETGALHEGRVLGIGDPTLPARILVAEIGNHWMNGIVVRDANGAVLHQNGPWTDGPQ